VADEQEIYEAFRGLYARANEYAEECRVKYADGLTISEFSSLVVTGLRLFIAAADSIPVNGAERKKWVLYYAGELFDAFADKIVPVYVKPFWFMLRPAARTLMQNLAGGAIESLLPVVRGTV